MPLPLSGLNVFAPATTIVSSQVNGNFGAIVNALNALPLPAVVSLMDPKYGVRGDGVTDDTTSVQACIDDAKAIAGANVAVILVPVRRYFFGGRLRLRSGVSLIGQMPGPLFAIADPALAQIWGPTFLITANPNTGGTDRDAHTIATPFLTLDGLQLVENIIFRHPNQVAYSGNSTPVAYPYVMGCNVSDASIPYVANVGIRRCTLSNAYLGIWLHGGQIYLEDLKLGCLSNGVKVDIATDSIIINRVHIEPVWDQLINNTGGGAFPAAAPSLDTYYQANCTGFLFWRADGIWMNDCSAEGPNIAMDLAPNTNLDPTIQSTSSFGWCKNPYFEGCNIGIRANSTGNPNGWLVDGLMAIAGNLPMIGLQINAAPAPGGGGAYQTPVVSITSGMNNTSGAVTNFCQINSSGTVLIANVRNYNPLGPIPAPTNYAFSTSPQTIINPTGVALQVRIAGGGVTGVFLGPAFTTSPADQIGNSPGNYCMGPLGSHTQALTVTSSGTFPTIFASGL